MAKKLKAIIAFIVAFAVVFPFAVYNDNRQRVSLAAMGQEYISDLTAIYSKYDKSLSSVNPKDEFGLARLMAYGWNGEDYGAEMTAYDAENDFAVLQFSSPERAKSAKKKMEADGIFAEADSVAKLCSDGPCSLSPEYSGALGVTSYLNNFQMERENAVVAVIDTGIMLDHTDLKERFINEGVDLSGDNMLNADYDTEERGEHYGHGTFVCGVIADNTPETVKLLPIKAVMFETEDTSSSAIISGINYAVGEGADVINISLGSYYSKESYEKAVANAVSKGVCICASAGNDSEEITARYPSCIDGVISVSSLNGELDAPASFTNFGDAIDFCAPGYRVYSTYPQNGESSYRSWSGTSFSSPYIAALCADIKSLDTEMSKDDVYETLCDFAVDLGDEGRDKYCGNGMPDIGNMVYSSSGEYEFKIPQGTLNILAPADYSEKTQPWRRFASKIKSVSIDKSVKTIGDYMFFNMKNAVFTYSGRFKAVGDYAFYNCSKIKTMAFNDDVENIGYKAFGNISPLRIKGYRNTPAESYALTEGVTFVKLGCKHNYYSEAHDPYNGEEGYTLYTCSVCGDSYRGAYVQPTAVAGGKCGENLRFVIYDTGKLVIEGSGDMYTYKSTAPWYNYRDVITNLEIKENVGSLYPYAFYNCDNIVKLYVSDASENYSTDGLSLFNKDKSEIILTFARGTYVIPESVENITAIALIAAKNIAIVPNSRMKVENSILYDNEGDILAALPSYRERTLVINKPISINEYAFILSDYPTRVETDVISLDFGKYSLGYTYNGAMTKHELTFYACADSGAAEYAELNGFALEGELYRCGEELTYTYDEATHFLRISGYGAMFSYSSAGEVPWSEYTESLASVEIADSVTALSDYAFYNAAELTYLSLPLSLKAPENDTVWYGCTEIKQLFLTYGNGYMDDYENESGAQLYRFTPWFLSKLNIAKMTVDSEAKYLGKYAFRACTALTDLTLNSLEEMGEGALLACPTLKNLTIASKNAVLPDYCFHSYRASTDKIYKGFYVRGYLDSTTRDYCDKLGTNLISLGCGHSRNVTLLSTENDGKTSSSTYLCADCNSEFTVTEDITSSVSVTVCSTKGRPLENACVAFGDISEYTDEAGGVVLNGIVKGEAELTVSVNECVLLSSTVNIAKDEERLRITVRYADYISDGVVNAKDYAFALNNGYNDRELFDFGRIEQNDNKVETVN